MSNKEFFIPDSLQLLEENGENGEELLVESVIECQRQSEAEALVKELTTALGNKDVLSVEQQDVFDKIFSLTRAFDSLPERSRAILADSLASNLSCLLSSLSSVLNSASNNRLTPGKGNGTPGNRTPGSRSKGRLPLRSDDDSYGENQDVEDDGFGLLSELKSYRSCYKIYTYFLATMMMSAEGASADEEGQEDSRAVKAKGRQRKAKVAGGFGLQWDTQRPRILRILGDAASVKLVQLYQGTKPEERLLDLLSRLSLKLYENKAVARDECCRKELNRILAACAVFQDYLLPVVTASLHHLFSSTDERIGEMLAGIGLSAEREFRSPQLTSSMIQEICRTNPKDYARANSGSGQAGDFLVAVAEQQPRILSAHLSLLMPHLEYGESYVLRNGIVVALGRLVIHESLGSEAAGGAPEQGGGPADENGAKERRLRSKQGLLLILLERARDTNAYVRSKVLQTWGWLCAQKAIPLGHWNAVVDVAAGRLQDKSSIVRKSALQLLGTMLQQNPFGPELQAAEFELTLDRYRASLMRQAEEADDGVEGEAGHAGANESLEGVPEEEEEQGEEEAAAGTLAKGNGAPAEGGPGKALTPARKGGAGPDQEGPNAFGLEQTRAVVASLEAGLKFAKRLTEALETAALLLASPTTSDVENCIQLLIALTQFQIDGASSSLRKILPLALSNEPSVREAVERAITSLHLEDRSPLEAARSLMELAGPDATLGELAALETLVQRFMQNGIVNTSMVMALWDFFAFNHPCTTPAQSTSALILLAMAAKGRPEILSRRIPLVLDIGLGRRAAGNPLLARFACVALQRVAGEDKRGMGQDHRVFCVLGGVIVGAVHQGGASAMAQSGTVEGRYSVIQQAVKAIYHLHPTPERFCAGILGRMAKAVFGPAKVQQDGVAEQGALAAGSRACSPDNVLRDRTNHQGAPARDSSGSFCTAGSGEGEQYQGSPSQTEVGGEGTKGLLVSSPGLSHFVFTAGHVALEHLVFVGQVVKAARKAGKGQGRTEGTPQGKGSKGQEKDAIAEELMGAAATDNELDVLQERVERQIMATEGDRVSAGGVFLIGTIAPVVVDLCRSPEIQSKNPGLHAASIITLSKLMAIDAAFCESNLQLLFTLLRHASEPHVRCNVMIALGDLALRWPNLVEPWTESMYAVLKDGSTAVRRHAVLVLSHLILNDMMRVKGYISDMAVCLEDPDKRIADLTGLFFNELSRKGSNAVYNLLPDILSRMSSDPALPEASLKNILQYLINFLNKERQMEGLIEKLAHRFSASRDVRLWRTLGFCLSLLSYSEKGVRKLAEHFKDYKDALVDEEVLQHLMAATGKAKKFSKPETKALVEELEERMGKQHEEKREEERTAEEAMRLKVGAGKKGRGVGKMKEEPVGEEEGEAAAGEGEGEVAGGGVQVKEEQGELEEGAAESAGEGGEVEVDRENGIEASAEKQGAGRAGRGKKGGAKPAQRGGGGARGRSRASDPRSSRGSTEFFSGESSGEEVEEEEERSGDSGGEVGGPAVSDASNACGGRSRRERATRGKSSVQVKEEVEEVEEEGGEESPDEASSAGSVQAETKKRAPQRKARRGAKKQVASSSEEASGKESEGSDGSEGSGESEGGASSVEKAVKVKDEPMVRVSRGGGRAGRRAAILDDSDDE